MAQWSTDDETRERVAAAIGEADCGSSHQAGVDGDDVSTADRAAAEDALPVMTGRRPAAALSSRRIVNTGCKL